MKIYLLLEVMVRKRIKKIRKRKTKRTRRIKKTKIKKRVLMMPKKKVKNQVKILQFPLNHKMLEKKMMIQTMLKF